MTDLADPLSANCFVIGKNQRNGYDVHAVRHERHLDALFNRNGETCRSLYDELCEASPTRRNIDRLTRKLKSRGLRVLETNVICYSSPMSSDLTADQRDTGRRIFRWLLDRVNPEVLIVHGASAASELHKVVGNDPRVIAIKSLVPPEFNKWQSRFETIAEEVADRAAAIVQR